MSTEASTRDEFKPLASGEPVSPTDYLPVMRQHLAEGLMALEAAAGKEGAEDLAQAYREGRVVLHQSALSGKLGRAIDTFQAYLSVDMEDDDEQLSE